MTKPGSNTVVSKKGAGRPSRSIRKPTDAQRRYLVLGLCQPGGKLPLFDRDGQKVKEQTIKACLANKWCEPWYHNALKPDWLVCKLTKAGRKAVEE